METRLNRYFVKDVVEGFEYSELEQKGLFGLNGKLTIQPEYQRNYIYQKDSKDQKVIESLLNGYPLGLLYFNLKDDAELEVLDGQQRITSIGRFFKNKFAVMDSNGLQQYFRSLPQDKKDLILNSELLVYECKGTETEIKKWFKTINIAGEPLNDQELLNAVYSGPFVSAGRAVFSNSNNPQVTMWSAFIKGDVKRQMFWREALIWAAEEGETIDSHMGKHRFDDNIDNLKAKFEQVIAWASFVFTSVESEMKGLEWGRLHREYGSNVYDPVQIKKSVRRLYADGAVRKRSGIFEFLLSGESKPELLEPRVFDEEIKTLKYEIQTQDALRAGKSNCPDCVIANGRDKLKIHTLKEMDADHVTAWSNGGSTTIENCEMLCRRHNQLKGNK
jgi:hypothetical protein